MAEGPGTQAQPGRLRATFRTPEEAAETIGELRRQGVPAADISVDDTDDRQHMLVRQQQQETPAQARGAVRWAGAGAVSGAVIVGALGVFMTLGSFSRPASIGLFAVVGALAGSSAGFVYGGGRQPEVGGELHDPSVDTTVAVAPTTPAEAAAAMRTVDRSAATDAEYETGGQP
jgi:hypothetical protein